MILSIRADETKREITEMSVRHFTTPMYIGVKWDDPFHPFYVVVLKRKVKQNLGSPRKKVKRIYFIPEMGRLFT